MGLILQDKFCLAAIFFLRKGVGQTECKEFYTLNDGFPIKSVFLNIYIHNCKIFTLSLVRDRAEGGLHLHQGQLGRQ